MTIALSTHYKGAKHNFTIIENKAEKSSAEFKGKRSNEKEKPSKRRTHRPKQAQGPPVKMQLETALSFSWLGFIVRISSSFQTRVAGGNDTAGRVEVFLNGQWGTVCDDFWDIKDATVACRQLGFPGAIFATTNAYFGQGQGLIHLDDVACKGDEDSILDCPRSKDVNCGHSEEAGIVCSLNVRLAGGNDNSGRVEVFLNGQWGTVCDDFWDIQDATVACRQLGFHDAIFTTSGAHFGQGQGLIHFDNVACKGDEDSILDCPRSKPRDCDHSKDAGIACSLNVRLANGNETAGRVEVFFNGLWGTVCDDDWDILDATVVCRQLGFPTAIDAPTNAPFGAGHGLIHLTDLACNGNESSIIKCHQSIEHKCGHNEDAGVVCLAVRLADGNQTAGRVEVFLNGEWGKVCDDSWDIKDATVVCRQIGFPAALEATSESIFGETQKRIHFDEVACIGNEHSIFDCRRSNVHQYCGNKEDAGVVCSADGFRSNIATAVSVVIICVLVSIFIAVSVYRRFHIRRTRNGEEGSVANTKMTHPLSIRFHGDKDHKTDAKIPTGRSRTTDLNAYNTAIHKVDDDSCYFEVA